MREITYLEAVREAMTQEMERDERVFMIGEDIGAYGGAFGASFGMLENTSISTGSLVRAAGLDLGLSEKTSMMGSSGRRARSFWRSRRACF